MHPDWWTSRARLGEPGRMSPGVARLLERIGPLLRVLHRPTFDVEANLPASGPFLLVANHSGGLGLSELLTTTWFRRTRLGADWRIATMAHPSIFCIWPFSVLLRGTGAIPSVREHALDALAKGIPVLVFPGGEFEAWRPIWQANRVCFGGHKGFLRLARDARVPIVPMGIRGSHYTTPILWRSRLLPYLLIVPSLLGRKTFALTAAGLAGAVGAMYLPLSMPARVAVAWAWLWSFPALMPWVPWRIHHRAGPPIPPDELFSTGGEEELDRAYQRVESEVQALVLGK
jgi:1-acyl-sn-glycerol-3-phosphate acyltransferase